MEPGRPPIEKFDPLLRDLVSWGLVVRSGADADTPWRLAGEVQDRLDELDQQRPGSVSPDRLVYLDHRCADCRARGVTRLVAGVYLCPTCTERRRARGR